MRMPHSSLKSSCGSADGKRACISWTNQIDDLPHAAAGAIRDHARSLWYMGYVGTSVDYLQLARIHKGHVSQTARRGVACLIGDHIA